MAADRPIAEGTIRFTPDMRSLANVEKSVKKAVTRIEAVASKGGLMSKSYTQPLGKITGATDEFTKSLEASNARVIAFGASAGIIYTVQRAISASVGAAINLEKTLADINVILNETNSGLRKFSQELFAIAKGTGQSFNAVSEAALEFARQGLAVEETLKRTRDAMILVRLSGLDVQSSVEAVTATLNSFNQTVITSTQLINKLANVDAAFAVSSADLAEAIRRVGSSAQDANVGIDELIAMVTTAQQVTARGGSVIGNSLKTIFTRLQRPAVLKDLEAFGVKVKDASGAMLPAMQVLKNFSGAYGGLAPAQKAVAAEMVGGVFQVNVLKAAVGDLGKQFSIYDRALGVSVSSTDQAIERNKLLNKTLSTLINESLVNVQKVGAAFANLTITPALTQVLESVNSAVDSLTQKAEEGDLGLKFGKGILAGISNILKGPALIAIAGILGKLTFSFFKFSTDALKTFTGLNDTANRQKEMQQLIQNILIKNPTLIQAATSSAEGLKMVEQQILNIVQAQNVAMNTSAQLSSKIAGNVSASNLKSLNSSLSGTAAAGFVPNYSRKNERAERAGAIQGGYMPGNIETMQVKGVGTVTWNDAETVKTFPGMEQPAIMPPRQSDAGKNYEKKFKSAHGFNPYAQGFVPNFNKGKGKGIRVIDGDTIAAMATEEKSYRLAKVDAAEVSGDSKTRHGSAAKKLLISRGWDKKKFDSTIAKGGTAAFKRGLFSDEAFQKLLVTKGLGVPDLRYANQSYLSREVKQAQDAGLGVWGDKTKKGAYTDPLAKRYRSQLGLAGKEKNLDYLTKGGSISTMDRKKAKKAGLETRLSQDAHHKKFSKKKKFAALGFIPNLEYGGLRDEDLGDSFINVNPNNKAKSIDHRLTQKEIGKRIGGKTLIRGPEGETLVVGGDLEGKSGSITVGGLNARKIKKGNPKFAAMLDQVPNLFDGLAYQIMGAVGAKFDPEGAKGAVAGVKFEQEFAAKHGLPEAGAKKGSDFILADKMAQSLGTQKHLQLKLSVFEKSKRDVNKVVDVASSFSKYLVDMLTNNIKTQGLSKLVGPDRFRAAMGVLKKNPALKSQWSGYFGKGGMMAEGLVPNLAKYQIGQKLPKGRGAGGRHLAVRDNNMGVHWDPSAMFHADLVERSGLQGKTMDGGWLHPNGRYEKIKGHDGSGLQANGLVPNLNMSEMLGNMGIDADSDDHKARIAAIRMKKKKEQQAATWQHRKDMGLSGAFRMHAGEIDMNSLSQEINPERVAVSQNQAVRSMGLPEFISTYGTGRIRVAPPSVKNFNRQDHDTRATVAKKAGLKEGTRVQYAGVYNENDARHSIAMRKYIRGLNQESIRKTKKPLTRAQIAKIYKTTSETHPTVLAMGKRVTKDELQTEVMKSGSQGLGNQYGNWSGGYGYDDKGGEARMGISAHGNAPPSRKYVAMLQKKFKEDFPGRDKILIQSTKKFLQEQGLVNKEIHGNTTPGLGTTMEMSHEVMMARNPTINELTEINTLAGMGGSTPGNASMVMDGWTDKQNSELNMERQKGAGAIANYVKELEGMIEQSLGKNAFWLQGDAGKMAQYQKMVSATGKDARNRENLSPKEMLTKLGAYANKGLVPNFAQSALGAAIGREKAAGYSSSQVKVGYDSRLAASGGIGVYNSTEGSLSRAISMHAASGKTMGQIQKQGASRGQIPNFEADAGDFLGGGASMMFIAPMFKDMVDGFNSSRDKKKKETEAIDKLNKAVRAATEAVNDHSGELGNAEQRLQGTQDKISRAETSVTETADKVAGKSHETFVPTSTRGGRGADGPKLSKTELEDIQDKAKKGEALPHGFKREDILKSGGGKVDKKKVNKRLQELEEIEKQRVETANETLEADLRILEGKRRSLAKHKEKEILDKESVEVAKKGRGDSTKVRDAEHALALEMREQEKNKPSTNRRISGIGSQLAFGAPMLGGMAGNLIGGVGGATVSGGMAGLGTGSAMAMVGAESGEGLSKFGAGLKGKDGKQSRLGKIAQGAGNALGPLAAVAGAGLAIGAAMKAYKQSKIKEESDKIQNQLDEVAKKFNAVQQSGQKFMEGFDKLEKIYSSPIGAKPEDMKRIQDQMTKSLADMPTEFRNKIKAAAGDADKIKAAFGEIMEKLTKQKNQLQGSKNLNDMRSEFATGGGAMKQVGSFLLGGMFGGKGAFDDTSLFERKGGKETAESVRIRAGIASDIASGADRDALNKIIESGGNINFSDKASQEKIFGKSFAKTVGELDSSDQLQVQAMMQKFFEDMKSGAADGKKVAADLKKRQAIEVAYNKHMQALTTNLASLTSGLATIVSGTKRRLFALQKMGDKLKDFQLDLATAGFEGAKKLNAPFSSGAQKVGVDAASKEFAIRTKKMKADRAAISSGAQKALTLVSENFMKSASQMQKTAESFATQAQNREVLTKFQRDEKAMKALTPVMEKALEEFAKNPRELKALNGISNDMRRALIANGYSQKESTVLTRVLTDRMKDSQAEVGEKLGAILQQARFETEIAKEQAYWAKQSAELQARLGSVGGSGDFLKGGETNLSSNFSKMSNDLSLAITASVSGGMIDLGRANANILDTMLNNLNLESLRGEGQIEKLGPLLGPALAGRMQDIESQINFEQRLANIQGFEGAFPEVDAQQLAVEQISSQLKLQELPEHVAKLRKNSDLLNSLIASQAGDMASKNRDAFSDALKMNGLHNVSENQKQQIIAGKETTTSNNAIQAVNVLGFNNMTTALNTNLPLTINSSLQPFRERMTEIQSSVISLSGMAGTKKGIRELGVLRGQLANEQNSTTDKKTADKLSKAKDRGGLLGAFGGAKRAMSTRDTKEAALDKELDKSLIRQGESLSTQMTLQKENQAARALVKQHLQRFKQLSGLDNAQMQDLQMKLESLNDVETARQWLQDTIKGGAAEAKASQNRIEELKNQIKDKGESLIRESQKSGNVIIRDPKTGNPVSVRPATDMEKAAAAAPPAFQANGLPVQKAEDPAAAQAAFKSFFGKIERFLPSWMKPKDSISYNPTQAKGGGGVSRTTAGGPGSSVGLGILQISALKTMEGLDAKLKEFSQEAINKQESIILTEKKKLNKPKEVGENEPSREALRRAEAEKERLTILRAHTLKTIDSVKTEEQRKALEEAMLKSAKERLKIMQGSKLGTDQQNKLLELQRDFMVKAADKKTVDAMKQLLTLSVGGGNPDDVQKQMFSSFESGLKAQMGTDSVTSSLGKKRADIIRAARQKKVDAGTGAFKGTEFGKTAGSLGIGHMESEIEAKGVLGAAQAFKKAGMITEEELNEVTKAFQEGGDSWIQVAQKLKDAKIEDAANQLSRVLESAKAGLESFGSITKTMSDSANSYLEIGGDITRLSKDIEGLRTEQAAEGMRKFARAQELMNAGLVSADVPMQVMQERIKAFLNLADLKGGTYDDKQAASLGRQRMKAMKAVHEGNEKSFNNAKKMYEDSGVSVDYLRERLKKFNDSAMETGSYGVDNLIASIQDEFTYTNADFYKDIDQMGREFARDFKSGTASAFGEAIKGTKDLKQAFSELFGNMADKMLDKSLNMATNAAFGAMGFKGMNKGGPVKGYSQGGSVVGGSGIKDDVPAYLSRGEYVIRRKAVNEYGKQFFESLNGGNVIAAASGGGVGDKLSEGSAQKIFGGKARNAAAIQAERTKRLNALSGAGITSYGYKESTGDTKEDWLGRKTSQKILTSKVGFRLDFGKALNEERIKKIQRAVNSYPEIGPFIDPDIFKKSTVQIGRGATKAKFKNSFIYNETKRPDAGKFNIDSRLSSLALNDEDNPQNKYKFSKADEFFGYQKDRLEYYADKQKELQEFQDQKAAKRTSFLFGAAAMLIGGAGKGFAKGGINKEDNIPALLTGGEYVMRKGIVDKYGMSFFESLNRGKISAFNSGGYVAPVTGASAIREHKLGEGSKSSEGVYSTNNINISINVDGNGAVTAESDERGASSTNPASQEEAKILADRVKSAVVEVISNEKRPGGMLYGTQGSV